MMVGGLVFWHDVWCGNLASKDALSDLYLISLGKDASIAHFCVRDFF